MAVEEVPLKVTAKGASPAAVDEEITAVGGCGTVVLGSAVIVVVVCWVAPPGSVICNVAVYVPASEYV